MANKETKTARRKAGPPPPRACRLCGCTDDDCSGCIRRTGRPCHWVEGDLCSACAPGIGMPPEG